jgi:hexosaminidase
MSVFKRFFLLALISFMASCQQSSECKVFTENDIAVIPKPVKLVRNKGAFQFDENTKFILADASQKEIVSVLSDKFKNVSGWNLEVLEQAPQQNYVQLLVHENLGDEAYKLEVSSNRILITSKRNAGFLYGIGES